MANITFSITDFFTSLKNKRIILRCNRDIDSDTVTSQNIIVLNKTANRYEIVEIDVDGPHILITLKDWPQPKDEYMLIIQGKIQSIIGEELQSGLIRNFIFDSEVISDIKIIRPSNFERINSLKIEWKETGDKLENNYYLEISKENAFYNLEFKTEISGKNEIELFDTLEKGQYYIRIRAQNEEYYGRWSNIVTFLWDNSVKSDTNTEDNKDSNEDNKSEEDTKNPNDSEPDEDLSDDENQSPDLEETETPGDTPGSSEGDPSNDSEESTSEEDKDNSDEDEETSDKDEDVSIGDDSDEEPKDKDETPEISGDDNEDEDKEDSTGIIVPEDKTDEIESGEPDVEIDDDAFIHENIKELIIEDLPTNGITPKEGFTFVFNDDIDISELKITVYRSDFD